LEIERKKFRKKLRENTEISARKFMTADKQAMKLVLKLAASMRVKVRGDDGFVNNLKSEALALATTQEMFIENRIEQVKTQLASAFRSLESASKERIKEQEYELNVLLERDLTLLNLEKLKVQTKIDSWKVTDGNTKAHIRS
jgi:hypothetical protein